VGMVGHSEFLILLSREFPEIADEVRDKGGGPSPPRNRDFPPGHRTRDRFRPTLGCREAFSFRPAYDARRGLCR
jgi:hypothetical protein